MLTPEYIQAQLLRAQRAMLIISDRIQDNFLYLYSDIYNDLKFRQRDIFILYTSLVQNYDIRSSLSNYDALVNVLVGMCQQVDSFNSTYNTINQDYQSIGESVITIVIGGNAKTVIIKAGSDILYNASIGYYIDLSGDFPPSSPLFGVYINSVPMTVQYFPATFLVVGFDGFGNAGDIIEIIFI
jgi:hypothetical protein